MMIADELQLLQNEHAIHQYLIGINSVPGADYATFVKTFCQGYDPSGESSFWRPFFPEFGADIDYGAVHIDEQTRLAFHKPGDGLRFDFLQWDTWENTTVLGHIILFDSACPMGFREVRSINETYYAYAPFPYVFATECLDHPNTWSVDDLRLALDISDDVPIVQYASTDFDSVKHVVLSLLQHVLDALEDD